MSGTAQWVRLDANIHQNHHFEDMGGHALTVFIAAIRIAKVMACRGGDITKYWKPKTIARWTNFDDRDRFPEALVWIAEGMAECTDGDDAPIVVESDGRVVIAGFKRYQPDKTNADRQKRHRDKDRYVTGVTEVTDKQIVTSPVTDEQIVTPLLEEKNTPPKKNTVVSDQPPLVTHRNGSNGDVVPSRPVPSRPVTCVPSRIVPSRPVPSKAPHIDRLRDAHEKLIGVEPGSWEVTYEAAVMQLHNGVDLAALADAIDWLAAVGPESELADKIHRDKLVNSLSAPKGINGHWGTKDLSEHLIGLRAIHGKSARVDPKSLARPVSDEEQAARDQRAEDRRKFEMIKKLHQQSGRGA